MTCGVAVKRPYDFEAYLSPDSGVEAKRSKQSHCHLASSFRPQLGTLAASLPHSQALSVVREKERSECDFSPFTSVQDSVRLSETQLESYLRAEVSYLKRRKLIPRRTDNGLSRSQLGSQPGASSYRPMPSSPSSVHSGSDSDGELSANKTSNEALYDKPQFSLKQVKLICQRLLTEQEVRLRYEYETILNKKLEEQHEQYVQFCKEQIERNNSANDFSYLS